MPNPSTDAAPAGERSREYRPSPDAGGNARLTTSQREQLRATLRAAVFAYKRGWAEDDVLDAIDAAIAGPPDLVADTQLVFKIFQ